MVEFRFNPHGKVANMDLAAFGRDEILLAEAEMPGLRVASHHGVLQVLMLLHTRPPPPTKVWALVLTSKEHLTSYINLQQYFSH